MSDADIFIGLGLVLILAVGCQIAATALRLPAIVVLLPVGFIAGNLTTTINPDNLLGDAFAPIVSLSVAVILFEGGLDLKIKELEGHNQTIVRRLILWGVPLTWAGAGVGVFVLLGLSAEASLMLGAILVVSGPTVVTPLLERAKPGRRLTAILGWEGSAIDPVGAVIGALVFQALAAEVSFSPGRELAEFSLSVAVGVGGALVGTILLWLLLERIHLDGVLATEATIAVVVAVAAGCNAILDDTGLIAAIGMGIAVANLPHIKSPEDRPFFRTIVQLIIGLLFISISATVSADSVTAVLLPSLVLVVFLVVVVRPIVAALATIRTDAMRNERIYIALMDPRGIVAASTAATFAAPLAATGIDGADDLLPVTFLVIVCTVTIYGLAAAPVARLLGLTQPDPVPDDADAVATTDGTVERTPREVDSD